MKTQKNTNPTLPSPVKFSIYIIAVALVCFLNWNALKASDFQKIETNTLEARLEAALVPVAEESIELEAWMLEVVDGCLFAENNEPEIALENWMLEIGGYLIAESTEPQIALEDWMLIVPDTAPAIEDWMVNTETWIKVEFLATK